LRGMGVGNECVDPGVRFCYTGGVAGRGVASEPPDRQIRWERLGGVRRSSIEPADRRGLVVRGLRLSAVEALSRTVRRAFSWACGPPLGGDRGG
jgi:hypothetical protein